MNFDLLNDSQLNIIYNQQFISNREAICIIACAGSGKTTTIINKVYYMISHLKCDPEQFILTTFTNNAANEIINRLKSLLDPNIIDKMTIGTFHSIALKEIIKNSFKINDNEPDMMPEEFLIKYIDILDDHQFKYIFIDEYQDINDYQYQIIKKWYETCNLLVVVGDDQQNIYTFRNTSIKYILNFTDEFENSKYCYLTTNYRSNQEIVTLSNAIIYNNQNKIDKDIICGSKYEVIKPKVRFFPNDQKEKDYILNYINKILKSKTNDTIAILSRTNKKLYKIENFLMLGGLSTVLLDNDYHINEKNSKTSIILSTIHSSKGLEFDHVIIINCVDGSIPIMGGNIEEERRLFYVGCTRAKQNLLITSLWFDKFIPSRFIYELYNYNNNLFDIMSSSIQNQKYSSLIYDSKHNMMNYLKNLNIDKYLEMKDNSILPSEQYLCFKTTNLDSEIEMIPNDLIHCNTQINIESLFCDFINIIIYRLIYECNKNYNYIYLNYVKNDKVLRNNSYTLKDAIKKYLSDPTDDKSLNKHITYFNSHDSELNLIIDKRYLTKVSNYLLTYDIDHIDLSSLTTESKNRLSNSYLNYQNRSLKTIDIIDDLLNLSLCGYINSGRLSYQFLIDKIEFKDKISLLENIQTIKEYITDLIKDSSYIDYDYDIVIANCIIGQINLIVDDMGIIINGNVSNKPSINDYIIYLLYVAKYNLDNYESGIKINRLSYYNPLNCNLYEWNIQMMDKDKCENLIKYIEKLIKD